MDKKKEYHSKKEPVKIQTIYSRSLLTRKVTLSFNVIGKNLNELFQEYIRDNFEGKCLVEGFIKRGSSKIINYSSGVIESGKNVVFEIVFECDICFPVAGMLIQCTIVNVVKAGIRAESVDDHPSPIIVFISKDHHYNNKQFNDNSIQIGEIITVRVIGQRFELNDKYISIIGELVQPQQQQQQIQKKPRITIQN